MQCGRVVQLFRRLSTGDSRLNINSHSSVNPVGRAFEIDKTLPKRRITSSSPILGTSIPPAVYVIIRPMASTSDNSSKPVSSGTTTTTKPKYENRLIHEKSPYLQQHANNPVDWYPWGSEAFDKAKAEDKLIFLSVGYSTCHWCHVMEKESFENESVADIMNKHFVNIKVDREERPDIDKIYMTFIQATSGGGGWPMSVFLTPDLSPVFGGTYFPPDDKWGRPGFKTVLNSLATKWTKDRTEFIKTGQQVLEVLRRATTMDISESLDYPVPGQDCWKKCIQQFARNFEPEYGGFSTSPKFPQPVNLNFLFHAYARHKTTEESKQCLEMCLYTLRKMANGGIHDHISSGFARYSVDNKWHVPHFEKMLYDQAQLTYSYCDAYLATKDQFYADIVRDILKYVGRDLSHPLGGFYSAEDADSLPSYEAKHKVEGAFCVWEYSEIQEHLGDKTIVDNVSYADVFCHYFNVLKQGNVNPSQDPHGELKKKNVLIIFNDLEDTSAKYNISIEQAQKVIDECKSILYEVRQKRPRPHLDDKMLCSWNGLMISGYAKAGQVLRDKTFIARAIKAAEFIKKYLYNAEEATLLRSCYRGENDSVTQIPLPIPGFVDDYAFLIRGLLDLYEACLGREWLEWAQQLQTTQNRLFWDPEAFGYFTSPDGDPSVVIRLKEDQDGAEPSGNSVSAHNLLRLAAHLETPACTDRAQQLLAAFKTRLERVPIAIPEMTSALMFYHDSPTQVFIAGAKDDPQTQALLEVVRSRLIPGRILAVSDRSNGGSGGTTILSRIRTLQGRPAAYVCRHYACSMPVTEVEKLAELLDEKP